MRNALLLALLSLAVAIPAAAQPYSAFFIKGSGAGYVEVPHSSAFDFSTGFTFEAWVSGTDGPSSPCSGIAGKGYKTTWWIGVCGTTLRSYIKGTPSLFDGGKVVANEFQHIAVTFDGTTRKHYVDGELVASRADSGPMTTNTSPMRLNSDVDYSPNYANAIDEVRIWNVARTQDELRSGINKTINAPQAGLVAVYHLDGNAADAIAGHNGTTTGTGAYQTSPVALSCGSTTANQLCLTPNRFTATAKWLLPDGTRGIGTVVPGSNSTSGLFWFFGSDNWELLVKVIDGCPVNNNKWVFAAATTNVHYQLAVTDVKSGQTKRYFNYFGQSAPAVTDTEAFATCP